MANEGSTKATYEELERALDIMTEKYKAEYGYVESAREERDQIAKTCDLLRAENLRVRGLLQQDAAGRPVSELLQLAANYMNENGGGPLADCLQLKAQEIESADIGKLDRVDEPAGVEMGKVNRVETGVLRKLLERGKLKAEEFIEYGGISRREALGMWAIKVGEVLEGAESADIGKLETADKVGDYSCAVCGFGMMEPCEHWKRMAGSAETGGEKANCNHANRAWSKRGDETVEFCFDCRNWVDDAGSREPEKLSNAQKSELLKRAAEWFDKQTAGYPEYADQMAELLANFALAESSLSSPPLKEKP